MKILAIFTCFNRKELTKRGMATLSENRDVTFDYVILDDNSSDGTREMLKQMRDDGTYQIDLIEGDGSNFLEWRHAQGDRTYQKYAYGLRLLYADE